MTTIHRFGRCAVPLTASLVSTLALYGATANGEPVVASPPVQATTPDANASRWAPTVAFGNGVYLLAWIERTTATAAPQVAVATVTHSGTLGSVRVTPVPIPLAPIGSGEVTLTSAFDGANFLVVWPTTVTPSGDVVAVARVSSGGVQMGTVSTPTLLAGPRIDVACGGGHCFLAGPVGTAAVGVVLAGAPSATPVQTTTSLAGEPSIEWNGSTFQLAWSSLSNSGAIVGAQTNGTSIGTSTQLTTAYTPAHARIACQSGMDCRVVASHQPPQPQLVTLAVSPAGALATSGVIPSTTDPHLRLNADVTYHGPQYLIAWQNDPTASQVEAIFIPRTGTPDLTGSLLTDPTEGAATPALASTGAGSSLLAYVAHPGVGSSIVLRFIPSLPVCRSNTDCPQPGAVCRIAACVAGQCVIQPDPACADGGTDGSVEEDAEVLDGSLEDAATDVANDDADAQVVPIPTPGTGPSFRGSGCACSTRGSTRTDRAAIALGGLALVLAVARRANRRRRT